MDENELIFRRWVEEVWNQGNEKAIDELFDKDGTANYPYFLKNEEPIRGIEDFKKFFQLVREKFSNLKIETTDLAVVGDKVIAVCMISAIPKSIELIKDLTIKEHAAIKCLCQYRIKDGKIVEIWNNVDLNDQEREVPLLKL